MAIKPGRSSQPDKKFGFGGGSENSPFKVDRHWVRVIFMVKIFFCVFKKEKIQIRGQTRFKENTATVPRQRR